jgi:hypothetical protein
MTLMMTKKMDLVTLTLALGHLRQLKVAPTAPHPLSHLHVAALHLDVIIHHAGTTHLLLEDIIHLLLGEISHHLLSVTTEILIVANSRQAPTSEINTTGLKVTGKHYVEAYSYVVQKNTVLALEQALLLAVPT